MQWNETTYSGWGRVLSATAPMARPERHAAISQLVSDCDHILAVGNLRSYGDAALVENGRALSTVRLDRLIEFDAENGLLEAEPGITLGEILRVFGPKGWMPAVLPGTGMTTLGGAIANDVHGKNHHTAGSFGQHVECLTLMTADGKARIISPETEPELFRATVGGVGQSGVVTAATIRLAQCKSTSMRVKERRITGLTDFLAAFETSQSPFHVGWIDALAKGEDLGRGVFEEADFDHSDQKPIPDRPAKSLPPLPTSLGVRPPFVRAFNAAYWRRVPEKGRRVSRPIGKFFFPLDKLSDWNRVYGKGGFHQFQCVVPPTDAETSLRLLLKTISDFGIASPLAVLKRLGAGRAGHLSFPMEGYTLAVDFPNRDGVIPLLERLTNITRDLNGRIYLAKDSNMSAETMANMYPELPEYQATVAKADPDQKFRSVMSERLNLRGAA